MAAIIPQVITEDRASGAQIIDGSLRFDSSRNQHFQFTPGSSGNRKTWTFSCWIKRNGQGDGSTSTTAEVVFSSGASTANWGIIQLNTDNTIQSSVYAGSSAGLYTNARFRDTGSFFHLCSVFDTTATGNDKWRTYINGVQQTYSNSNYPSDNTDYQFSQSGKLHRIGYGEWYADFQLSQCYFIDGQALGPENFGFTDPLTNTWRPKKLKISGPNNGTTWSSTTTMNANVFDGALADTDNDRFLASSGNGYYTATTAPFTINQSLSVFTGDGYHWTARLNGSTEVTTGDPSTQMGHNPDIRRVDFDLSGVTLPLDITNLELKTGTGSGSTYLMGILVDGVVLIDGDKSNMGLNGFHLPFDGSAPIGQDQSGNGNNWTPVNFGGSNTIEKATGALPILNTDGGGKVARVGVFGSEVGAYYAVTVPGGIGGGYYLDGTQKPALSLIRGATYTFDQSDSSNSGHPLVFGTTADGNDYSDGVTTNGTPGSAGAYTKITVPHNAPNTLYYHCSAHGGMGSSTSQTTDTKKADPYAWKNVLALPLDGSKDDVSNQINSGSTTKTITNTGTADASSAQSNFYGGSFYFDGTNDYLSTPHTTDLEPVTGDFTVECWIYPTSIGGNGVIVLSKGGTAFNDQDGWTLLLLTNNTVRFFARQSSSINLTSNNTIALNTWNHIAVSRSGSTLRLFLNGTLDNSTTNSQNIANASYPFYVGRSQGSGGEYWNRLAGYAQDVRFYKGLAKYTSNFIPASTNPDILPDTPSGVSGSSKLTKITDGGSIAFGTAQSDYLHLDSSGSDLTLTTNFSIEFFYNESGSRTHGAFITDGGGTNSSANSNSGISYQFYHNPGGFYLNWSNGSGNWGNINGITMPSSNGWHHVVATNDGSRTRLIVDGVLLSSSTDYPTWGYATSSKKMYIGTMSAGPGTGTQGSYNSHGFMSDIRICNGSIPTEYQTSATTNGTYIFSPPARSLTTTSQGANSSHVKLLCAQSQTSATEAAVSPVTISKSNNVFGSNFNPFTTDINAVRGQETGYATLNPLRLGQNVTLSNGNLRYTSPGGANGVAMSTIPMTSGKYYCEFTGISITYGEIGICNKDVNLNTYLGGDANGWMYYSGTGEKYNGGTNTNYGATWTNGDVISIVFDADIRELTFYKNGVSQGVAFTGMAEGEYYFAIGANSQTGDFNFGQNPFKFPPPDGFQPLNAANVRPTTVIARPDQYVGIATWTGDGTNGSGTSNDRQVTGLSLKPDLVWCKIRTQAYTHVLWDSVRGAGSNKQLQPNEAEAEGSTTGNGANTAAYGYISEFTSDGFKTLTGSSDNDYFDKLNNNYVAWCWKAGGNSNTFNIDDVGYANASDVNMNPGVLNSSTYNSSEVWSTTGTLVVDLNGSTVTNINNPLSNVFEGSLASSSMCTEGTGYTSGTKTYTYTFGTAQTNITSARIYLYQGNSAEGGAAGFGNGTVNKTQDSTYGWLDATSTIPANGTVTAMTMTTTATSSVNSARNGFIAIELNGKMLLDNGVTPVDNFPSIAPIGCSVGTKQGFGIITYSITASSGFERVAHGLSQAPEFGIFKCTDTADTQWGVYYTVGGSNANWLQLNSNIAQGNGVDFVKYYDKYVQINYNSFAAAGSAGVGYIWHSVPGFSKFGSYNGTDTKNYIHLGFRPALVIIKSVTKTSSAYSSWMIQDAERSPYNPTSGSNKLWANRSTQEGYRGDGSSTTNLTANDLDFDSNGFYVPASGSTELNESGQTFIYAAWAEAPTFNLYGAQSNAR